MNKADLLDLFDYTEFAWKQLVGVTADDAVLLREAPGSGWPSLRNCLGHMVVAYGRWSPAIIDLKTGPLPELGEGDFLTWKSLDEAHSAARGELRARVEGWSESELASPHEVEVYGEPLRYSRSDLILHILLHERGHHGDVTTLFWQLGIEAETTLEYRFHLRR